jgi:hypothetical protein
MSLKRLAPEFVITNLQVGLMSNLRRLQREGVTG